MAQKGYSLQGFSRAAEHENRVVGQAREFGLQAQVTVLRANWAANDGRQANSLFFHVHSSSQGSATWWYESVVVEGKGKQFQAAVKDIDQAVLQIRHNPKWTQYAKQVIAQQNAVAQQNFNQHQQRMINNQRNFEATQNAINDANNAVNQSIMDNWNTYNQSTDYTQQQFTDYIRDEQNVYDPNTGNSYKVESGYNQYYINENGQYIGTNDYNYDPNQDPSINNQNWYGTEPYH